MHELDAWLRVYEEELRWARQHELLRSGATSFTVALTGALWAVATSNDLVQLPIMAALLTAFTAAINVLAWYLVNKHYERARRHQALAGALRKVISKNSALNGLELAVERKDANTKHENDPQFAKWQNIRAYKLWGRFHLALAVAAVPMLLYLLCCR